MGGLWATLPLSLLCQALRVLLDLRCGQSLDPESPGRYSSRDTLDSMGLLESRPTYLEIVFG